MVHFQNAPGGGIEHGDAVCDNYHDYVTCYRWNSDGNGLA